MLSYGCTRPYEKLISNQGWVIVKSKSYYIESNKNWPHECYKKFQVILFQESEKLLFNYTYNKVL